MLYIVIHITNEFFHPASQTNVYLGRLHLGTSVPFLLQIYLELFNVTAREKIRKIYYEMVL